MNKQHGVYWCSALNRDACVTHSDLHHHEWQMCWTSQTCPPHWGTPTQEVMFGVAVVVVRWLACECLVDTTHDEVVPCAHQPNHWIPSSHSPFVSWPTARSTDVVWMRLADRGTVQQCHQWHVIDRTNTVQYLNIYSTGWCRQLGQADGSKLQPERYGTAWYGEPIYSWQASQYF